MSHFPRTGQTDEWNDRRRVLLQRGFRLDSITVDAREGALKSARGEVRLEPKVMQVLVELAAREGEVVSREDLQGAVWGDVVVSDDALARCLYVLRHELPPLLGENAEKPVIETLRKRGFRLLLTPRTLPETTPTDRRKRNPAVLALICSLVLVILAGLAYIFISDTEDAPIQSIAVLPLLNLTGDDSLDYLADGFSEQLSHTLANVPELRVAARTSAFYFKDRQADIRDIARRLNVDAVIEGSIRRQGANLRVTLQLLRKDGFHIWSREFNRAMAATLDLQSDISEQLLAELELADREDLGTHVPDPTHNLEAYDLYLQGRYLLNSSDANAKEKALGLFERAIEVDPEYALSYSGIADLYSLRINAATTPDPEEVQKAWAAAERALELQPALAEAHASKGLLLFAQDEYAAAEAPLRRAIELNSNYVNAHNWLGLTLVYQDRFTEATQHYERAQLRDPLNLSVNRNLGANLMLVGRPEEGLIYLQQVQSLNPQSQYPYQLLASWSTNFGRLDVARRWISEGLERHPDNARLWAYRAQMATALGVTEPARKAAARAHELAPEDLIVMETAFSVFLADQDIAGIGARLNQLSSESHPLGENPPFGKPRVMLRWRMMEALLRGSPEAARDLGNSLGTAENLVCSAFGHPGAKMYLAYALGELGEHENAKAMTEECLEDANRVIANGAQYPRAILRLALSTALAGNREKAAEHLATANQLGWSTVRAVARDPLWVVMQESPAVKDQFDQARARLRQLANEVSLTDP